MVKNMLEQSFLMKESISVS